MPSRIVEGSPALSALAARLSEVEWLAVDSEGDGFHRYRSQLCTIQLAADGVEAVVDPLALDDLSPLAPLLSSERPIKVFHDVGFDARMLHLRGLALGRVFDTSIAARFLSEKSTGLAAMLESHFDVKLDKELQQADWGVRPIDEARLGYLLDDVRHLVALARELEARAAEADILEEIEEETRYAIARAVEPEPEPPPPWTRIKGTKGLTGRPLALLAALAEARERVAEERDVPPFRVAHNRALLEVARRGPRSLGELARDRGMRKMPKPALRDALEMAEQGEPPVRDVAPAPAPADRARRKAREKALTEWRSREAERRAVDVQVVLPGHCLRDLAGLEELGAIDEVPGLGAKRLDLYREALLAELSRAG